MGTANDCRWLGIHLFACPEKLHQYEQGPPKVSGHKKTTLNINKKAQTISLITHYFTMFSLQNINTYVSGNYISNAITNCIFFCVGYHSLHGNGAQNYTTFI